MIEDCKHLNTETRKMSHCNQIKLQCLDCGMSVGHAIKHSAIAPNVLAEIQEFDQEFRDLMIEKRSAELKEEFKAKRAQWEAEFPERHAKYIDYLNTPEWKAKRELVIDRENGICQGCRSAPIQEVHHATYKTLGNELLFQLVGLCSPCHRRAHPDK